MTLGTFEAVKLGGSKEGPGASTAIFGGSGCNGVSVALKDGSGKEGEPEPRVGQSRQAT